MLGLLWAPSLKPCRRDGWRVVENWKLLWIQFALLTVKKLLSVRSRTAREEGIPEE